MYVHRKSGAQEQAEIPGSRNNMLTAQISLRCTTVLSVLSGCHSCCQESVLVQVVTTWKKPHSRHSYQHSGLCDVARLCLLFRNWLHVLTVCGHGGVGCRGVHRHHLDTLILEELQPHTQTCNSVTNTHSTQSCTRRLCRQKYLLAARQACLLLLCHQV